MGNYVLRHEESSCLAFSRISPIQLFFFFHKAIRAELENLCLDAHVAAEGERRELQILVNRFELLRFFYEQHSNAEDEVVFPALDSRVKNIAPTYLLEHQHEDDLFEILSQLLTSIQKQDEGHIKKLQREIVCSTEALQRSLDIHMSKEEEQVFSLLLKHFGHEEQAALVWQFLCRIPVSLLQRLLQWITTSLSQVEKESMIKCMQLIVPEDESLQHVILSWLEVRTSTQSYDVNTAKMSCHLLPKSIAETEISASSLGGKRPAYNLEMSDSGLEGCSTPPIDDLMILHASLEREFMDFADNVQRLQAIGTNLPQELLMINNQLKVLMDIRVFYSVAEDKIIFPEVLQRMSHIPFFVSEHSQEELRFRKYQSFLECVYDSGASVLDGIMDVLYNQAGCIARNVYKHLKEEAAVFPLVQQYFSIHEQQILFYNFLQMLPLQVLQKMLPWLSSCHNEDEIKFTIYSIKQAGQHDDKSFVNLLISWLIRWRGGQSRQDRVLYHLFPCNMEERQPIKRRFTCDCCVRDSKIHPSIGTSEFLQQDPTRSYICNSNASAESWPIQSYFSYSTYPVSCLLGMDCSTNSRNRSSSFKPIDCVFQFHRAIQKDLEFLDKESEKVGGDDLFLRQFTGRFTLLWGLYRAHSSAEDEIVFPALEGKEALHNISHSYVIDHEQEEQLFKDISDVLTQLSTLHESRLTKAIQRPHDSEICEQYHNMDIGISKQKVTLSAKLQGMCKSLNIILNQHISREESELWPILNTHFSVQEQEKIVGRIIGTMGAEVLQSMIPWVTAALSLEEQSSMFDTWLFATRNTMFDKWLHACFPSCPVHSTLPVGLQIEPQISQPAVMSECTETECLRIVAEYLAKDTSNLSVESTDEDMECMVVSEGDSSGTHFKEGEKLQNTVIASHSDSPSIQDSKWTENCNHLPEKETFKSDDYKGSVYFKAGWQDIFKMNQKQLEAAVRKVSNDDSLDPRQKAYLMQNLMTSRWIVAQQRQTFQHDDSNAVLGLKPSFHDQEKTVFGCEHYKRNCKLVSACCGLLFTCRFCHDNASDHTMDRQSTKEMMCMKCLKIQPVAQYCRTPSCNNFLIAKYYCNICKFFDNDIKDIYHCPYCNICRVGKGLGIDFFHCMTCNACMSVSLKNHKCREKGLESNCPICHDFMFTSKAPVKALSCGHFMHSACFQAFINHHYTCPICCKSVGDMSVYFGMLDGLLASEELPEEYKDRKQDILCNDCEQKSVAPFHWLYHKCAKCGSYNTRVI
ncbi:hypothetical protein KP509_26G001500 [Ceratopteris richardii]|uniref:Zinc finger protein BRUTUS n=1 Tax=Ceratopteris richardii TaxID=49495 RepID=A0A8T2RHU3_CERRI|nr:hypothetical protein KP509_26G001500 [Ceratopteris richardii]